MRYAELDLTLIDGNFGIRYIIDYADVLQNDMYLGKILSSPDVTRKNNIIKQVRFQQLPNFPKSKDVIESSNHLKNRLKKIKADLENILRNGNDPNVEQAHLIFNCFEERWFEPDNISLQENSVTIIQWGIKPERMPEFIQTESTDIKDKIYKTGHRNQFQAKKKKNNDSFLFGYMLIAIVVIIIIIIRSF